MHLNDNSSLGKRQNKQDIISQYDGHNAMEK